MHVDGVRAFAEQSELREAVSAAVTPSVPLLKDESEAAHRRAQAVRAAGVVDEELTAATLLVASVSVAVTVSAELVGLGLTAVADVTGPIVSFTKLIESVAPQLPDWSLPCT